MRRIRPAWPVLLLPLLSLLLLTGCVSLRDPESSFEYTGDVVITLDTATAVGQTFLSRRSGLNGLQLWVRPASADPLENQQFTFELYRSPQDADAQDAAPLASLQVPYSQARDEFPLSLSFPPQNDPPNQSYYLRLATDGPPLAIYGRGEDGYPDGALYVNGSARLVDLAFRTSYDYAGSAFLQDLQSGLRSAWIVIPLLLLLWVPGRLALELAALGDPVHFLARWDWTSRQALSLGLSLALIAVGLLWTTSFGLHWSRWSAFAAALLMAFALAALIVLRRRGLRLPLPDHIDLALVALFALSLGFRLAMVRDLAAPAWVDPVHHTLIARLIVEQGVYPASYAPYVEAGTASYHPGFHALAAGFHWLTNIELSQSMLLLGQVLNALIAPAVYLLAVALSRDRPVGLFAALIASFMTSMPAYYASWGRYTQLAGLLVLPTCAAILVRLLEEQVFRDDAKPPDDRSGGELPSSATPYRAGIRLIVLAALACSGLLLVHYRVMGFLALLMIAVVLGELLRSLDKLPLWTSLPRTLLWIGSVALLAVVLSLPWWPDLYASLLAPNLSTGPPQPDPLSIDWGYLLPAYGRQALWLALAGLVIAVLRAAWFGPVLALWIGLLFMAANQGTLPLPMAGLINKSSVEIMLFMPVAVLGGYALSSLIWLLGRWIPIRLRPAGALLTGIAMLGVCWLGLRQLMPIINPATLLFRESDRPAMEWIATHIPNDETILINPFLWGYGVYAGRDGGYWITPLAGVKTMPPNLLYGMGSKPDFERVNRISQSVLDYADDPLKLHEMMIQESLQYVYAGRRGGALPPHKLAASGLFETLYSQDGVWIFQVR